MVASYSIRVLVSKLECVMCCLCMEMMVRGVLVVGVMAMVVTMLIGE